MTRYDPDWVRVHYDQYAEKEWQRWDRSPVEQVKLAVHLHYLRQSIRPGDRVLEIGAASGRFTQELARITQCIVVADLSPVQLALNQQNAQALGFAGAVERWVECDMCDLKRHFHDAEFDAVVCYGGPLSYVFDRARQAVGELTRVTKPGGMVLFGVMSLWGGVHHLLPGVLQVPPQENRRIVATGDLSPETSKRLRHFCHMFRATELRALLQGCGLAVEVLSASDCLSATWTELLETVQKDDELWQHLLELELEACREPGCVDMGTHTIAVCRKPIAGDERAPWTGS
jgi:ubiquinone/menaquinone biosynthesis C-methylase UbiE